MLAGANLRVAFADDRGNAYLDSAAAWHAGKCRTPNLRHTAIKLPYPDPMITHNTSSKLARSAARAHG